MRARGDHLTAECDQIIAQQIGRDSVIPSIEVATENQAGYVGACDVGYSCAYMNTLSWKTPTTPLPMDHTVHQCKGLALGRDRITCLAQ